MKKKILYLIATILFHISFSMLYAQQVPVPEEPRKYCGTDEATQKLFDKYPGLHATFERLRMESQNNAKLNSALQTQSIIYTIPVVVHVLHNYGSENISDAQIKDAIAILNRDFQKQNADTATVMPAFKNNIANIGIQFTLAQIDPNGNCTNGIDRIATTLTYKANDTSKLNDWSSNQYLNIWTCASMANVLSAGYSYYPGSVPPQYDGIMVLHNYVGSIGTSNSSNSRTLTHEVGHWLDLCHTWACVGSASKTPGVTCGDDGVTDTPETKGWTSCDTISATAGVCNPGTAENIENYMEYSYCTKMFTAGQKSRMLGAITSSVAGRNNLWKTSNLTATGVNNPAQLCIADFSVSQKVVCVGTPVKFTDLSWGATNPTSWQWDFDNNGTVDSTTQNPTYTYTNAGTYSVTLTASAGVSTKSATKASYISVLANTASIQSFYYEDFENTVFPYSDFYLTSTNENGTQWARTTSASYTGAASMKLNNFSQTSADVDVFITPAIDLSSLAGSPSMTFKLAHAQRNSADADKLVVYTSTDCGVTWISRYSKPGTALANAGINSTAFTPSSSSQWRQETVNILNVGGQADVRFKFQFTSSGAGNNIYIDDINIGTTGIAEEFAGGFDLSVFPNPFNDNATISFYILNKYNVSIGVYDIVGREVMPVSAKAELHAGTYSLPLNRNALSPGVYFVTLNVDGYSVTKKVIVQ
ncbi:MAG: T9SS type A sorting domain-containing protein [Bacteroidetes bacterium]|nr:T9SS type A sorting domain-containing protein [Bacteroidota bacterium]